MSAEEFLRRVEQTGLVSEPLLEELRKRVSDGNRRLRPEMLAKLLVDREELTAGQARKIITQMTSSGSTPPPLPADDSESEPTADASDDEGLVLVSENDDLGFATEDEEPEIALSAAEVLGDAATEDDLVGDDILGDLGSDPVAAAPKAGSGSSTEISTEFRLAEDDDEDEDSGYGMVVEDHEVAEAILLDDEPTAAASSSSASGQDGPPPELDEVLADPIMNETSVVIRRKSSFWELFDGLFPKGGPKKKRWDSPLILVGGGALVLLAAAAVAFFTLFQAESADEIFTLGNDAYEGQSYGQAIQTFGRFNETYPNHEKASLARVRIDMSKLRQITDLSSPDWESALTQANTSLPSVKQETAFSEARSELAKLLPDITAGLVEKSRKSETTDEKQRVIDLATSSLTLVNNPEYLPTSIRKPQDARIEEIETNIQIVRRDIEREQTLAKTVEQIKTSTEQGNITEAYALRDTLVDQFPILTSDTTLRDTLSAVTAKERDAVQTGESNLAAEKSDRPPTARLSIVLADQRGQPVQGVDGHILGVLVRGAAYGVRATDGAVLWRRHLGYETDAFPKPIDATPGSDLLVVDGANSELQRLDARTGKLVWRLPCPKPISSPTVHGGRAFVCCGAGSESRLVAVDLAAGKVTNEAKFPVGCTTSPSVIESRNEVVQVGNHSSVYVLDVESLACKSVFATGHTRGSVKVPPAYIGGSLVIAENNGRDACTLHTFSSGESGDEWLRAGEPIKITGQVVNPPSTDDRRMLVITEFGGLHVFETPIDSPALRNVATTLGSNENIGRSFASLDRSSIWVGNKTFTRFELQSTRGKVVSTWSRNRNDQFLNPLMRHGDYLFHVRRRVGMQGATVAAVQRTDEGTPIWETDLGVPSEVVVNSQGKVHAVTANGAMFPIASPAPVTNKKSARIDQQLLPAAFSQMISVSKDQSVFVGPPPTSHFVVAALAGGELQRVSLRIDPDRASTPLVSFGNSLLAACETGPIYVVDSRTGKQQATPFMPRIEAGSNVDWLPPAALGGQAKQFIAAEKTGRLYRVAVNGKQTTMASEGQIEGPIVGGLAAAGNFAYAVVQNGGSQQVVAIDAGTLQLATQWPLDGGISWGPKKVGALVIAADASNKVYAFDGAGKLRWQIDDGIGSMAGDPLAAGNKLVFTSTEGQVSVVDASGNIQASKKIREPFGSGAVAFKGRLLIAGWDGTLYLLDVPQ